MQQPPPPPYPGEPGQAPAYPPQQGYPQQPGYPPQPGWQAPAYPQQAPGYPPQAPGYPPQAPGYPPQAPGYQAPGYPSQAPPPFPPQAPMGAAGGAQAILKETTYDQEPNSMEGEMGGFGEKAVRRGFIRKVYGILMCQLILTGGIIAMFTFVEPVKFYVYNNMWIFWASFVATIVLIISLACCSSVRRKAPMNFIFLGLFTFCEGILLGVVASMYGQESVIIAVGITCGITLALTIFAFQTKFDFTTCGGFLLVVLIVFILVGFLLPFLGSAYYARIGYGAAGAAIFGLYIVYDTQLMMGGSHKYALSPEEYVFAALNLYLDVINLFMYILMIVGAVRGD